MMRSIKTFGGQPSALRSISYSNIRSLSLSHLLVVLLGLSVAVRVKLGPTLLGSDVLILIALPLTAYHMLKHPRIIPRPAVKILGLLLLWLAAATVSDIYNHTSNFDMLRGVLIIPVFAATILTFSMFIGGRRDRERLFAVSLTVGFILSHFLAPEWQSFKLAWKFEIGIPAAIALTMMLDQHALLSRKRLLFQILVLVILGLLSFFWDFRSLAGFIFLAAIIAMVKLGSTHPDKSVAIPLLPRPIGPIAGIKSLLLIALTISIVFSFYNATLNSGWLSKAATRRANAEQSSTLGIILGGRPEILISRLAIEQRPILGYGSWPHNCKYISIFKRLKHQYGISTHTPANKCLIPTHSHLFGAWVWAGLLAIPVWLYCLFATGWWCLRAVNDRRFYELAPLLMGEIFVWNILFSPFSGRLRVTDAFYIAVIFSRYATLRARR